MTRVGTCQDCGAKYKIPDSVTATKAKCKKCGGVVAIPALAAAGGAAATAAKPAAAPKAKTAGPAKSAPTKRASTRSAGAKSGAKAGAKSSGRAAGSRRSGGKTTKGKRSGGKRGGASASKESSPMPMILGIVALLLVAGGVWWFGFREDPSSTTSNDTSTATTDDGAENTDDGASDTTSDDTTNTDDAAAAPEPAAAAAAPAPAADTPDADDDSAPAAAAAAVPEKEPEGPYDPVIVIEPIGPVLGTTADQVAEWEQKIHDTFLDPPHPKVQKTMIAELNEIDIVDLTPAIMNSMNGLDISDGIVIRDSFKLIEWWQKRTAGTPTFTWVGDASRRGQDDIDLRIKTINSLVGWWDGYKTADQERLDALRKKIEDRLASKG